MMSDLFSASETGGMQLPRSAIHGTVLRMDVGREYERTTMTFSFSTASLAGPGSVRPTDGWTKSQLDMRSAQQYAGGCVPDAAGAVGSPNGCHEPQQKEHQRSCLRNEASNSVHLYGRIERHSLRPRVCWAHGK